jgi:hypothetical protein
MEMAVNLMETAVEAMESMEMAPGALPHPGRVPEQRLLSREIGLQWRRCCITFLGKTPIDLGFRSQEALYRQRGSVRGGPGGPHHALMRPGGGSPRCGCSLAPLRLSFGLRLVSRKNRRFGLCFVQFREYFLCSFFETQKQQKQETDTMASRQ